MCLCTLLQAALPHALFGASALAEPATPAPRSGTLPPADGRGLQSPEQRSIRFTAYSLPNKVWSLDAGALGLNTSEVYGLLGVARGFKHGIQLDLNLVHWGVGLFGLDTKWCFFERPHLALAASVGFRYGHGGWIWILNDLAQDIVSDSDLVAMPVNLIASAPLTRWLQADLVAQYTYAQVFGTISRDSFYGDSQVGVRQLFFRPTVRFFLSDATAFEVAAKLPAYTKVPVGVDATLEIAGRTREKSKSTYIDAEFEDTWNVELGLRSRLRPWLYASMRVHFGQVSKSLYGAPLYPSFALEFRL